MATFRSGQILDWSSADKVALLVLIPCPFLLVALGRAMVLLEEPELERYIDRASMGVLADTLVTYLVLCAGFAVTWWRLRKRSPESPAFIAISMTLSLTIFSIGAYLLGPVSTPIFGTLLAVICAILLFFEARLASGLVAYAIVTFFAPLVLVAARVLPYGPVFREAPFVGASFSPSWVLSSSIFALVVAIVPAVLLGNVVRRWRARDEALLELARLDPLTGVSNRRYFFDRLEIELSRARRHETRVAMLLLDLDHFKRVNDAHGHLAGDAALVHVAHVLLHDVLRRSDVVGRYGGEEFAVLLPETDSEGARAVAERCRVAIASSPCRFDERTTIRLSVSIGVAVPCAEEGADSLVQRVDSALYRAKSSGRDRVVLAA